MPAKRRYGGGSVTSYSYQVKAKNGRGTRKVTRWRWQLRVPVDPEQPDGATRLAGKSGFETAAEAEAALTDARQALAAGSPAEGPRQITMSDYAQEWIAGLQVTDATRVSYQRILRNHVVPQLGHLPLTGITATRLRNHYAQLRSHGAKRGPNAGGGLSPNTISKVHAVIGSILDSAFDDDLVRENVAKKAKVGAPKAKEIRASKPEITTWTPQQLRAFLDWNRDVSQDDLNTFWTVIAHTGLRRGEAVALRWGDLNTDAGTLAVRRAADEANPGQVKVPKSSRPRVVDLRSADVELLQAWRRLRGAMSFEFIKQEAYIFGNHRHGGLRETDTLSQRWARQMTKARGSNAEPGPLPDLPRITIHELRHSHATHLLQAGVQPKIVQERLGHASISITMDTYSHVLPSMQRQAVERLDQLLEG
ncbi:integrase [Kocuria palustris]